MDRILIIDDDAELCALVARFLTAEGFEIDRAANAHEGIKRALGGSYALIMLDVMMPDLNGFDVLRQIRAQSRTPVLMLTARGDTHDRVLGLELGADDYLPKPYDPSELAARIRAILRRSKTPPSTTSIVVGDVELNAAGLGLAIAQRAIAAHGGTIRAKNAPDGGLIVEIDLTLGGTSLRQ